MFLIMNFNGAIFHHISKFLLVVPCPLPTLSCIYNYSNERLTTVEGSGGGLLPAVEGRGLVPSSKFQCMPKQFWVTNAKW